MLFMRNNRYLPLAGLFTLIDLLTDKKLRDFLIFHEIFLQQHWKLEHLEQLHALPD